MDVLGDVDRQRVVFGSVGTGDRSAMPLGNGELCASVWTDARGLHFTLSRSDALSELDRTLKLGQYGVVLSPNPFDAPDDFTQSLNLVDGRLEVTARTGDHRFTVEMHIDTAADDAHVHVSSTGRFDARIYARTWRTRARPSVEAAPLLWGEEDPGLLPELAAVTESADLVGRDARGVYLVHRNDDSLVPAIARLHELEPERDGIPDVLLGRSFGSYLTVDGHIPEAEEGFRVRDVEEIDVRVATFSSQVEPAEEAIRRHRERPHRFADSRRRTADAWREYWGRSWIVVEGDTTRPPTVTDEVAAAVDSHERATVTSNPTSAVTRAYVLTKWMHACGNRGRFPLFYNGGLFTTMPGAGEHLALSTFGRVFASAATSEPTPELNPDERTWSVEHLWQNLRLPYYSVLGRGEAQSLIPVFDYYRRFEELNRARARRHHDSDGQWSTEMTLSCGLQSPAVYGADRRVLPVGTSKNRWGGSIDLSPGLELAVLMQRYYRFTRDEDFLRERAVPYAVDLLRFAWSRFSLDAAARLVIGPVNSVETYFDTTDPLPVVAGYHRLTADLLALPHRLLAERDFVQRVADALPALPRISGETGAPLAPAGSYEDQRMNVEIPEFYAVFPFDVDGLDDAVLDATWDRCLQVSGNFRSPTIGEQVGTPSFAGWQYLGPVAARIGRIAEAAAILEHNASLSNPGHAFPAMWGPVYDAVPDVDHGANILNTLQEIVLAIVRRPELARRLPTEWSVRFRLFAEDGSPVSGLIGEGVLRLDD